MFCIYCTTIFWKYRVSQFARIIKLREDVPFVTERMTWEQIQKKYPNQWVGLVDVRYQNDDGISVESAIVKYTDKTKSELTRLVLKGEIISRHTNPEGHLQLGMVGVL